MVGRDQEAALLIDRWERAAEGDGQVVLIIGEPGIGKSRMVRALDQHLVDTKHHRLELRCSPYYSHTPLYPLIERLPQRLGWIAGDSEAAEIEKLAQFLSRLGITLNESVGLLATLLSRSVPDQYALPPMSPERQRRRTLELLTAIVLALAETQPVLLAVEDLHWADATTLELLGSHIEQAPTVSILIVLTARPGFAAPWRAHSFLTLTLNRLTRRQTAELVQEVAGERQLPTEVFEQIVAKTDGVPLFVEELTKMVLESGLVTDDCSGYEFNGRLPELAIPSTLQDSLTARLDRLGQAKTIAQLGAVLGRSFGLDLIREISGLDEAELRTELDKLIEAELLFERGTARDPIYVFKHALVQEAAYQSLLKSARQEYHERIAHTITERFPGEAGQRPEYVAHQFIQSGLNADAVPWLRKAAELAVERSAYAEAIAHLRNALEVLTSIPHSIERDRLELDLQHALGSAFVPRSGHGAREAREAFGRATELAAQVNDPVKRLDASFGLCVAQWMNGEVAAAHDLSRRSLALALRQSDCAARIVAHHLVASTGMMQGLFCEAKEHFERALELYGPVPRAELTPRYTQDTKGAALHWLAPTLWFLGYPEQARARYRELADYWPDSPFLFNRIWRSVCLVQTFAWLRTKDWDRETLKSDLELCDDQNFSFMKLVLMTLRGALLAQQGCLEDGIAALQHGIAVHRSKGVTFSVPIFYEFLAEAYVLAGRAKDGLDTVSDGLTISAKTGERRVDAELHRLRGELFLLGSSPGDSCAEGCFLKSLEIARAQQARSLELRSATSMARLWERKGKRTEAKTLLRPIYSGFTEGFGTPDLQEAKVLLERLN